MNIGHQKSRIGLAQVRASQNLAKVTIPLVMRLVFIPMAWPLTVIAARLNASPNQITALRTILIASGALGIACPAPWSLPGGLALYLMAVIADSIDGNLSRLQDSASYFGKYFDGLVDMLADLALPVAIGLRLWLLTPTDPLPVIWGVGASIALAITFLLIHRLAMFELMLEKAGGAGKSLPKRAAHPRLDTFLRSPAGRILLAFDRHGMNVVFDLRYIGLAAALCASRLDLYLVALAGLYALTALAFSVSRLLRGYDALDVRRSSRSAA